MLYISEGVFDGVLTLDVFTGVIWNNQSSFMHVDSVGVGIYKPRFSFSSL
jgi:hypothetical protein